jgi:hypothetical protein
MTRFAKVAVAFVVIGGLAASSVTDRGAFMIAFFVLFFGGIAAAIVGVATRSSRRDDDSSEGPVPHKRIPNGMDYDIFIDQNGVRHQSPQPMQRH